MFSKVETALQRWRPVLQSGRDAATARSTDVQATNAPEHKEDQEERGQGLVDNKRGSGKRINRWKLISEKHAGASHL